MNEEYRSLELICEGKSIHLNIHYNEKTSMFVAGGSRMGKTYFLLLLAVDLIQKGFQVHLIDLGDKWSRKDKERLKKAGALIKDIGKDGITFIFNSADELIDSAKHIANALGTQSVYAKEVIRASLQTAYYINKGRFDFSEFIRVLKTSDEENAEDKEWRVRICERLESYVTVPKINFCVENDNLPTGSMIWDLGDLDETYSHILTHLIMWHLLCQKKREFRNNSINKSFIFIDEFQTLDCNRRSIVGLCLTEGQKYGLSLILATQFLKGNFSDAVINQLKQGGFRFYFRLTEEEAAIVSRQLVYDSRLRVQLQEKLAKLPVGNCLMLGPHTVGEREDISENIRFIKIDWTYKIEFCLRDKDGNLSPLNF